MPLILYAIIGITITLVSFFILVMVEKRVVRFSAPFIAPGLGLFWLPALIILLFMSGTSQKQKEKHKYDWYDNLP